ncbi:hypothetical protein LXL04_008781 [Taraxacum kok-saghyz]
MLPARVETLTFHTEGPINPVPLPMLFVAVFAPSWMFFCCSGVAFFGWLLLGSVLVLLSFNPASVTGYPYPSILPPPLVAFVKLFPLSHHLQSFGTSKPPLLSPSWGQPLILGHTRDKEQGDPIFPPVSSFPLATAKLHLPRHFLVRFRTLSVKGRGSELRRKLEGATGVVGVLGVAATAGLTCKHHLLPSALWFRRSFGFLNGTKGCDTKKQREREEEKAPVEDSDAV